MAKHDAVLDNYFNANQYDERIRDTFGQKIDCLLRHGVDPW